MRPISELPTVAFMLEVGATSITFLLNVPVNCVPSGAITLALQLTVSSAELSVSSQYQVGVVELLAGNR